MKSLLRNLYYEHGSKQRSDSKENDRIHRNMKVLKNTLNKQERKLLLRIQDDNDLLLEETSIVKFIEGVSIGAKLILEILNRP